MKKTITEKELAKIFDLLSAIKDKPIEDIELTATELDYDVNIDMDFDFDISMDLPPMSAKSATPLRTAPAPAPAPAPAVPCHGTRKISIRVPNAVLNAFREQAKRKGTRGQTLINRVLKDASKGW